MDTKRKGNSVELNCISRLYDCGCEILIPYGDSQLYDIVIEYNNKFYKIQCKHSKLVLDSNGEVDTASFKTSHECGRKARKQVHYTKEDIDFFATFVNGECYLIPVEETGYRYKTIRFKPTRCGRNVGVNFATDYEAKKILSVL